MTRLMLWSVLLALVLLLGGILAQMMLQDSGVMMLTWNGWMVETTFWTGIGALITLFILWIIVVSLVRRFGPARLITSYRNRRDQKTAKKDTALAINHWLKGGDDRALKSLQRVINAGGSDRLPAAVSLAIGLSHGDWMERYGEFISKDPELKLFADTLQAERLWQAQKEDDFIDLLRGQFELRQIPWLRERLWQAMMARGKAAELVTMINEAANIQPELRQRWLIRSAEAALSQSHGDEEAGTRVLKPLSKSQRNLPDLVAAEVPFLASIGQHDTAFKRVKQLLSRSGDFERADLLLPLKTENLVKLNYLESILPSQTGPVLCRTLGVLSMRQQLWGNAQNWLEQAWQQGDKPAGLALAQLFEQRNMTEQSARLYKQLATGVVTIN